MQCTFFHLKEKNTDPRGGIAYIISLNPRRVLLEKTRSNMRRLVQHIYFPWKTEGVSERSVACQNELQALF